MSTSIEGVIMNLNQEAAEILEKSADDWESGTIGWTQGAFGDLYNGVCALGMCRYQLFGNPSNVNWDDSTGNSDVYWYAINRLVDTLNGPCIDDWNDEKGRTKEDVIELFKQTAKDLRNRT